MRFRLTHPYTAAEIVCTFYITTCISLPTYTATVLDNAYTLLCDCLDLFLKTLSVSGLYRIVDRATDKYGSVGRIRIGVGNWSTPRPLCPPQIPHVFFYVLTLHGTRGSAVGWGTMLQIGTSRVRFQMRSSDFLVDLILPAALRPMGSSQPLTEMSTRNLPGGKGRPVGA
jgi:hypothetical protein